MNKVSISELNPPMKVQCISTKCGFYSSLKLGKWYNVVSITNYKDNRYIGQDETYFTLENGKSYDSCLFRDIQRFREMRLNKLLS
jgi:hypothetical protein